MPSLFGRPPVRGLPKRGWQMITSWRQIQWWKYKWYNWPTQLLQISGCWPPHSAVYVQTRAAAAQLILVDWSLSDRGSTNQPPMSFTAQPEQERMPWQADPKPQGDSEWRDRPLIIDSSRIFSRRAADEEAPRSPLASWQPPFITWFSPSLTEFASSPISITPKMGLSETN